MVKGANKGINPVTEKLLEVENATIETKRSRAKQKRKTRKEKAVKEKQPQDVEDAKVAILLKGTKTSETINSLLNDLHLYKKPNSLKLGKKRDIHPFEDVEPLEALSRTTEASLFLFASHTKKRPNNLVIGRMFDNTLLDMIELGIENYKPLSEFNGEPPQEGNKPLFVFQGAEFEQKEEFKKLANMLLDFFRGEVVDRIDLQGLEHCIVCSSAPDKVYFRVYRIKLKKSGSRKPRIELVEIGPSFDMTIRRTRFASEDMMREALKKPASLTPAKKKNITQDEFGVHGTIHVQQQNLATLQQRKAKALRVAAKRKASDTTENGKPTKKRKTAKQD